MFRSPSTLVLLLLLAMLPGVALAQNTGKLAGLVTDASTGEPLIGANVFLPEIQRGAAADLDGNYVILGIPVGQYTVQISFAGYETQTTTGVEISSGRTRQLDAQLSNSLGEVVVEYERPIIQRDAIGVPKVVTGEDIQNLPVRGVQDVAAIQSGVVSNDGSGTLNIRGGRGEEVDYYIDGVKVVGSVAVPQAAIAEQEMLIGTIPPQYGDATSGVISISTLSGGSNFFGTLEGITSTGIDGYGYNLGALSLGGPIVPGAVSFFGSVQGIYQEDATQYAIDTPVLNDATYNLLQQSPQVFRVQRGFMQDGAEFVPDNFLFQDDDFYYVSIPADFDVYASRGFYPDGSPILDEDENVIGFEDQFLTGALPVDSLAAALGIPGDAFLPQPIFAYDLITAENTEFTTQRGIDDPATQIAASGNLEFRPISGVNLRVGGAHTYDKNRGYSFFRSVFNRDRFSETTDRVTRGYASLRQVLSNTAFYQLQAEYSERFQNTYPEEFGDDINQILNYGDLDNENNAVARRYLQIGSVRLENDPDAERQDVYVLSERDGNIAPTGAAGGLSFTAPGNDIGGYSKFDQQQFRVFGTAQTQVGVHELSFGGEYETRTQRFFSAGTGFTTRLARFRADDEGANDENCPDVNAYSELAFGCGFDDPRANVRYYGYNYLGTAEADSDNLGEFVALSNTNVAPYKPIYYGGYVRDRIEYRDLVLDLGVRLDVFDNNTRKLIDPFALVDIYRVRDVVAGNEAGINVPNVPSIPDVDDIQGLAVYATPAGSVLGYRDNFGRFFDENGEVTSVQELRERGATPVTQGDGSLSDELFEDYEPQLTIMPRIGVTFPVTNQALFFASFNVTSQRPSENAFASIQDFAYASESSGTLNNPGLRPETTTQYELGFRQSLGDRAALTLSGFYRTQRNKITLRNFNDAFPSGYTTYTNQDFTTTKGMELAFELRRTRNLAVNANYTLSFAEGTGSDSRSANLLSFRTQSGIFPETLAPLSFDQRHNVNLSVDYRLGQGEGPMIGGIRPLEGFGFNLLGVFKSGNRYTQLDRQAQTSDYNQNIGLLITGSVNEVVIPSTTRLDLKVDRGFNLGPANFRGYVWVQNLLDTDNVIGVYRTTGLPDDDGFLASDPDAVANLPSQLQRDSYEFLYSQVVSGPINPGGFKTSGGSFYSPPRRIRLGVTLDF